MHTIKISKMYQNDSLIVATPIQIGSNQRGWVSAVGMVTRQQQSKGGSDLEPCPLESGTPSFFLFIKNNRLNDL